MLLHHAKKKFWGETLTHSMNTCFLTNKHSYTFIHHCIVHICTVHPSRANTSSLQCKTVPSPQPEKQKHHPPKHLPPPRHTQTNQATSHVPDRLQTPQPHEETCVCVFVCVCVCVLQESKALYLAPMKTPAAEAVKPSTRYLVFKSFLTSLSARARPFMPLPLLSVIKANLNPLIISPQKTISPAPLEWLWGRDGCVPCKVIFCPF